MSCCCFFSGVFCTQGGAAHGREEGDKAQVGVEGEWRKKTKKTPAAVGRAARRFFFFFLLFFSDLISLSLSFPSPAAGRLRGGLRKRFFSIVSIVLCCCRLRLSYFVLSVFLVAKIAGSLFFPGVVFFFPRKERKEKKTVVFLGLKRHGPSCSC